MTKNLLSLFILSLFFLASCDSFQKKGETASNDTTVVTVGGFAGQAEKLADKAVTIEGTVLHTCKHGGKRMFLVDNNNDSVTVEVTAGGEIAKFDEAIIGSKVKVFGILKEEKIDTKYLNEWEAEVKKPVENHAVGVHTGVKGHEDQGMEDKLAQINALRAELKASGKDHLSNFSIEATSFQELK
ncbi:MAG TPA: hypothetical protein VLR52_00110 [Bacteroidales bacterium]|nr:hypothetical protein [Bacteroidales bacterium]